jgi:type III secretory pathway component EscR
MDTYIKITLGFLLGVGSTVGVMQFYPTVFSSEEEKLKEDIRLSALKKAKEEIGKIINKSDDQRNVQYFELSTQKGIVKLHTYMSKDSVKILMGRPESTSIMTVLDSTIETWEYKGRNEHTHEFTIKFENGELNSVQQFSEN